MKIKGDNMKNRLEKIEELEKEIENAKQLIREIKLEIELANLTNEIKELKKCSIISPSVQPVITPYTPPINPWGVTIQPYIGEPLQPHTIIQK